ncbi:hypothetical protein K7X08_025245 [Anisodus acutangulus]|uniref:Uncharacterized protein n=1 Tax=Anisodus acutangulus TaxID=402998 RepID=A0A9Q1MD74_9SOLA|nr:hypothetical protein K7X08_025245 [Anisodus acutangulus]
MSTTFAGKVPAIIVFGDSSVDVGNNNQISSNFEPYGRDFYDKKAYWKRGFVLLLRVLVMTMPLLMCLM